MSADIWVDPLCCPQLDRRSVSLKYTLYSWFYHILPQFLLALIDHTPDIYLDEIQEQFSIQHDLDVSLATISRTLKRLGISSKKVCLYSSWIF